MKSEAIELVRGSGNVFRDLGHASPDVEQLKAILAAEIIKMLDRKEQVSPQPTSPASATPTWPGSPSTVWSRSSTAWAPALKSRSKSAPSSPTAKPQPETESRVAQVSLLGPGIPISKYPPAAARNTTAPPRAQQRRSESGISPNAAGTGLPRPQHFAAS